MKHIKPIDKFYAKQSRPTRARGLKPYLNLNPTAEACVAPHAGAWIET